jgi:hypothetical protein
MNDGTPSTRMARVYIGGPLTPRVTGATVERLRNIHQADMLNYIVWDAGGAGFCPHVNTQTFGGRVPEAVFLDGDLAWLEVADAVMLTPDWATSLGAREEASLALAWGIPIFVTIEKLKLWLSEQTFYFRGRGPAVVDDAETVRAVVS